MSSADDHLTSASDTDELLGEIIGRMTEQLERGESIDLSRYAKEFPGQIEQIEQLLPTLRTIVRLGCAALDDAPATDRLTTDLVVEPEKRLGDFRIGRELGRGGMGVVYEAEQISMGRRVALKVLPFAAVMDERAIERFKNEARAAGTLHHDHIVPVHAVGNERGVYYYAMALIEGVTLAKVIEELRRRVASGAQLDSDGLSIDRVAAARGGKTGASEFGESRGPDPPVDNRGNRPREYGEKGEGTERVTQGALSTGPSQFGKRFYHQVARIGVQAAEALHHAHEQGIVHRDVKPGNLMVDTAGKAWVTDFGLARIESDAGITLTGDVLGTLRYMAPEQALGKRCAIDQRADVYSLGATLYELLTRSPLFETTDRRELLQKIAEAAPRPPRKFDASVPRELETIALKALEKEPADRYATAADLADDLRRFQEHRPILARPPSLPNQVAKWARRHVGVAWTLVVASVALSIVLGASTFVISGLRRESQGARDNAEKERRLATDHEAAAVAARREGQQLLYASDMQLASRALDEGDVPRCVSLLERHLPTAGEPDLREFAWRYLRRRTELSPRWEWQVAGEVRSLAASPDGSVLAACTSAGGLFLLNSADGVSIQSFAATTPLNDLAWSPDGKQLAAGDEQGNLHTWSWESRASESTARDRLAQPPRTASFSGHDEAVTSCVFTPDGEQLLTSGSEGTVLAWDPRTGSMLRTIGTFSPGIRQTALAAARSEVVVARYRSELTSWSLGEGSTSLSLDLPPDARSRRTGSFWRRGTWTEGSPCNPSSITPSRKLACRTA